MPVITSRDNWPVDNQEVRMKKGPLVRVELQPGRFVKMHEADAIARGLLPDPKKKREKPDDKMRRPERDKEKAPTTEPKPEDARKKVEALGEIQVDDTPEADTLDVLVDFETIPGVGAGTARALAAHGITTFEQLMEADELDYLTPQVNAAIEEWRSASG